MSISCPMAVMSGGTPPFWGCSAQFTSCCSTPIPPLPLHPCQCKCPAQNDWMYVLTPAGNQPLCLSTRDHALLLINTYSSMSLCRIIYVNMPSCALFQSRWKAATRSHLIEQHPQPKSSPANQRFSFETSQVNSFCDTKLKESVLLSNKDPYQVSQGTGILISTNMTHYKYAKHIN